MVKAPAMTVQHQEVLPERVFEERAENLSREELTLWTSDFPHNSLVIQKLTGTGAKLLIGPRGSGKSTLLRQAYFELLDQSAALPVYVNYSKSLALEPLFSKNANALALFRQWLLMKIVLGTSKAYNEAKIDGHDQELTQFSEVASQYVAALEGGREPILPENTLGPSRLVQLLEQWSKFAGRSRCVLFLDDAAHAFSAQQQREFFEIFRELRSRYVAPKAAVYPGITEYSPYFHVGHDGEPVPVWADLESSAFLQSMYDIVLRRFPESIAKKLERSRDVIDTLSLASFGLPRSFLNMLSYVLFENDDTVVSTVNWSRAREAIRANADSMRSVFLALTGKLPRYRRFIELGSRFEEEACNYLRKYNSGKALGQKAVALGLKDPLGEEILKVLGFLEYAGIVRKYPTRVSRGVKGRFQRYTLHFSVVVSENVLSLGKSTTPKGITESLLSRHAHSFPKLTASTLLGDGFERNCIIALPPCPECGVDRLLSEARFCHNCGEELTESSVYEEALAASVDSLPITEKKKASLKSANLNTVKAILLAEPSTLRSIRGIGSIWAARLKTAAEEHVSV